MNNTEHLLELSERIPLIGREKELKRLESYLHAPGSERHFVYYWARGGLGKTRLLEELERIVKDAGSGFHFSGIIDLYHTDTHSTSDLERIIVEGLASGQPEKEYFKAYRHERSVYELLRERGTDPGILEQRRAKLGNLFIEGCREMALDARKLVICFDTVELLQYESSIVEEKAGLQTADSRVKPWLLEKLSQLTNVLVVFAGRPKLPAPGEEFDPQKRLVADMEKAFGEDLTLVELQPFTLEETCTFFKVFGKGSEIVPSDYLPIVHRLTGGRPIFLHLIGDRLKVLAPESRTILELFDDYAELVDAPDDARLERAREQVEHKILDAVFNNSGEIGGYLTRIAMMPKGVDPEILHIALGLPVDEAVQLLKKLMPLSFVKQHKALRGGVRLHEAHIFLHDELYRLLTLHDVIPYLRMNERSVASTLVQNYYAPHIQELEKRLAQAPAEERVKLREQWQKLQVERVYYLLVANPREGYEEYKRLTAEANRHRWVGFGMRLLDELLRFYNRPERRKLFESTGVSNEQVIRESAHMWVERFYWWGQNEKLINLAERIFEKPDDFFISCSPRATVCSEQDLTLVGNIYAFWAQARAKDKGYESMVVEELQEILDRFPPLAQCTFLQALAMARVSNACGYQYRLGGMLDQATEKYSTAKAAYRRLGKELDNYLDGYASLLNNLSFVYATLGRMAEARTLAHEALRLNEMRDNPYTTGLTLSTLSQIARMRESFSQALAYGEEALHIFRELGDSRGIALAYLGIAQAKRMKAKHELEKGRRSNLEEVRKMFEEAHASLQQAQNEVQKAGIRSLDADLISEQGRVSRDLGRLVSQLEGLAKGMPYYSQSARQLREALNVKGLGKDQRADILQDLAEVLFDLGDQEAAQESLKQIETVIGQDYLIIPGEQIPNVNLPPQHFEPLGKVEMLRGQMAFSNKQWEQGIKRFILAYAYFTRFSTDAIKKETMVEYLYKHLQNLPIEEQQQLITISHSWVEGLDLGVDVAAFMQIISELFGV